jgi:hypothetical protein
VDVDEAESVSRDVLDRFRALGLITGRASRDCVLGGKGYRPGPAVAGLYKPMKGEYTFWKLATCGVEPVIERGFNECAMGPSCDGYHCSACGADIGPFDAAFDDSASRAVRKWLNGAARPTVQCPRCGKRRPITEWECRPPLGFGNLAFRFWNWPPLDSRSWKIDVPGVVREVCGHTIVRTYGHF